VTGNDAGSNAYIRFCFGEIFIPIRKILSRNAQSGEQKALEMFTRHPRTFMNNLVLEKYIAHSSLI